MCMKRIKPIQMQMQPARMDKVLCFSSNIFILLKTDLVLSELRAPVCVQCQTHRACLWPKACSVVETLLQSCLVTALIEIQWVY